VIFRIKHYWPLAFAVTLAGLAAAWALRAQDAIPSERFSYLWLVGIGLAGGVCALIINGILHEILKKVIGKRYLVAFEPYGKTVLDGMHWPAYLTGGLMAAFAEEPIFRGLLLPLVQRQTGSAVAAILIAAAVFAACHWLCTRYLPFWFWAMWEGVVFGILTVWTGSILPAMIAHGLHDVVAYRIFASLLRDGRIPMAARQSVQ